MVLILNSFELISEEILFKKTIDDKSYLIVTTRVIETNIMKIGTRAYTNEFSNAHLLYVKTPDITNIILGLKILSKSGFGDPRGADMDCIDSMTDKIFDIFYNPTNGDYAIFLIRPYASVNCVVGKRPLNFEDGKQIDYGYMWLNLQNMVESSKLRLAYYANGGKILYNPENGQFKVIVNTKKGIDAMFEWKNNKWVEIEK